jgi:hypothetical protein
MHTARPTDADRVLKSGDSTSNANTFQGRTFFFATAGNAGAKSGSGSGAHPSRVSHHPSATGYGHPH